MIIGSRLFFFDKLPSTNTQTVKLLESDYLPEGSVIYTSFQTAGRGQKGNSWESEEGKNLLISIVLYPYMLNPNDQFLISMTISLGVCDFLRRYVNHISIKWPNDIYVNNDKIAGILIENFISGNLIEKSIAGIGLNINQRKFLSDAPNPVSLALLTRPDYDLSVCLDQLIADIDNRYKQLISENYFQIREEYISHLFHLNRWKKYRSFSGEFTGRILSVRDSGELQVEKHSGKIVEYRFKEIDFVL